MQAGRVDLGNLVDDTYTGIIHGSASLIFYPYDATVSDRPPRPDVVVPMAADAIGHGRVVRIEDEACAAVDDAGVGVVDEIAEIDTPRLHRRNSGESR